MQLSDLSEVTVSGRNPYPFINAVRQSPLPCYAQYCTGDVFRCKVRTADLPELRALADAYHMQIESRRDRSVQRFLRRYRLRFGILIGIVLSACLILWQSNTVEHIELQGNHTTDAATILQVLSAEGVDIGSYIPGIDMGHCEYTIRRRIPGIAWCGIRHTGSRLIVEIAEETPHIPMHHSRTPCNIIAAQNAQITDVEVYCGCLHRLPGSGVAKGDLIVSGTFENADGITTFHHAYAKITGIYTKEAELTVYREQNAAVPTGRITRRRWLRLFGMKLPLFFHADSYAAARTAQSEVPLSFLQWQLPVSIVTVTDNELSETAVTYTPEELRLALQSEIVRYEQNILDDVEILDRSMTFEETGDALTCHLCYTVEGEIGEESAFYVKFASE
ncbi:MAG: sporulation protein YqfD [Oscillospiraceae bacterium]|nr:sporulation protein YqfD [Oscillospiraceae bacterium]